MAFFEELTQKAKSAAAVAADKTKAFAAVAADKTKDAAELVKTNVAIAGEQKEIDKNYRTIGEWFVNEYDGEIPDAVRELVEAIVASKNRIAELEAGKTKEDPEVEILEAEEPKLCMVCGAAANSKFCPQCGAPMDE